MANANSTIEIELEIKQALDRLNRLERELQKSAQQMQKAADATGKLEGALNKAKTAAAGLFAFFSGQQIVEAADQFTNFANAVRISTSSVAEQTAVQKELYRVAQTTGSSLGDISKLYGRLRQAADQLGSSQAETIKITEIVGKALAASGTSASEASGALLQLAQALNSPRVQAEEFNSLVDAMPNLLRQVERQLGITAGGLKKFVTDGQLSNKLFRDAILGSAAAIDDEFGKANDTIATALTRLNNAFILLVGNFEESTGFFNKTAAVISGLAENMDELVRVLKAVAVGFAIAFAPKVIRAIRDTATAMATLGAASKTNVIGALAALGFYIADITGGLDLLTEKLGLTKDETEKTADAIADLTKVSGGGVAAIAPVVPVPSQSYLQALDFMRSVISDTSMTSEQIMASLKDYSEAASAAIFDVQTKVVSGFDDIDGATIKTGQGIEEIRHIIQLFGLAYEQALGREAGESANVLALQFLAAQQAMKVLLDLRDQELAVIAEVEARIAEINERGIERTESERIILRYQNEIAEVMADETFSLLQRERIVKALESARDRELENAKEVLTYQEMITDELQTQLGLSESAASAAVSGYFGAGPSASRAGNILQSKSLEEAAYKLVFSNEKVASAINEQFELLFDVIDPLIDILADLQAAINRLIKALLNAGQGLLDTVGLGQDSYLFGGGFAKDIESLFGGSRAPRGPSETQLALAAAGQTLTSEATVEALQASFDRYGIEALEEYLALRHQEDMALLDLAQSQGGRIREIVEEIKYLKQFEEMDSGDMVYTYQWKINMLQAELSTLRDDFALTIEGSIDLLEKTGAIIDDLLIPSIEGVVDKIINYADPLLADFAEQAGAEALAAQEGISVGQALIQYRNNEQLALIETQRALAEYITDLEEKTRILGELSAAEQAIIELNALQIQQFTEASNALTDAAIADIQRRGLVFTEQQEIEYRYAKEIAAAQENTNLTTADQIRLVNALEAARQREIDAIERSQYLLGLTQAQTGLAEILKTFQDAIQSIQETVEGLYDQAKSLLFSDFNLMPVMDQFQLASAEYQNLLEKAFSPDATEEDIENLQGFVNQYLTSAKDVFKSSSKFQEIFEGVLADLTTLGVNYGIVAPIGAAGEAREDIADLGEEFGISVEELITSLDSLVVAFTNQQLELVYNAFEVDISDQIFFTISEEGYIVEIPATSIEVSIAEDFSATATFTPEITGFSTSDEDTTGDYSGYASFDAQLTGFGLTAEDATGDYSGYASFDAELTGFGLTAEDATGVYNGYSSFFANLSGMSTDSENPQEYNGYSSFFANLAGMSEDSENPFEINGYSSLTATLSNMNMDSENPFEINGYAGLTATLSNLSVDADDPYVLDGYAQLRATLTNLTTSSIAPYILDAYSSLRGWATNMSWDSANPYQLDAYTTLVANLTVDDSGFTSAWSSFQVAVTTAVNDFIDLLNAAIDGIESGEPIPTTLSSITYLARPTPGVSGAGVSAYDYGTYNLAHKYSESSRGIVESLGMGIYDQIANPLESYVIQFSQGYNRYMFTFDDLNTARYYYNLYAGDSPTKYGFRQGGLVPDPMDTIPAMLSPGEYILSPETVRRFGVSSLNQLNSGDASAISQTNDPEVKRLLAELIQAVRESDTEVNVYTDMRGQAKAAVEEFRSEIKERSRRQGDQFIPVRYI